MNAATYWIRSLQTVPGVEVKPHFEKVSLRLKNKIWITWREGSEELCVKLTPEDQQVYTNMSKEAVYPVPNKWGQQGWTLVNCEMAEPELLKDMLVQSASLLDKNAEIEYVQKLKIDPDES